MATKLLSIALVIDLTICAARVQSQLLTGTPTESASSPKYRTHKKIEASSPAETAAEPSAAESPAASPKPKRVRRKPPAEASPTPTPTPTPVPSPTRWKFRFPRLFKPKRSASPSPVGVNPAPARFADPRAAQPQGGPKFQLTRSISTQEDGGYLKCDSACRSSDWSQNSPTVQHDTAKIPRSRWRFV
jgi:hypothetical protein